MTMTWIRLMTATLAVSALGVACSEAADDEETSTTCTTDSTSSGMGGTTSAGPTTTTTTGAGAAGGGDQVPDYQGVVINEISIDGDDWIELYNTSGDAVTFADGIRLTDYDDVAMGPKVGAEFNGSDLSQIMLPAGAYLLAVSDGDAPDCGTITAPNVCVTFGAGLGDGDTVYLIDGSDAVLLNEPIPLDADVPIDGTTFTWGRFPNATGPFQMLEVAGGTPADANTAM